MCGIIGFSGGCHPLRLHEGLVRIAHRGPDDYGTYIDPQIGIGLGHVRLSIIDPSLLGHQPMVSPDGAVVLVFNGEIYNFQELRRELKAQGYSFRGHSDTEVLLNLYLAQGEDMLSRLNGIFAFALWDSRSRTLLLARDALGIKPLYIAASDQIVAFSSEIKGLLSLLQATPDVDPVALYQYVSFLYCPGERTAFEAVKKVSPGEAIKVQDGKISRRWFWYELPLSRGVEPRVERDYVERTRLHLKDAVHRQMIADVPVGAFLSGGLDSSSVVALARDKNPDIHCFTIELEGGQEGGMNDDLLYAKKVAAYLGVPLEVVSVSASQMACDLEEMVTSLDEPLADPAPLNVLYICRLAREQGMKVLLSGAGGDDMFTGYRRHQAVLAERYWRWLPHTARRALSRATSNLDQRRPLNRRLAKLFRHVDLDGNARVASYFAWAGESDVLPLFSKEYRYHLADHSPLEPLLELLESLPASTHPLNKMLVLDQRFFLGDHNLLYTDKMSMATGLEVRVPFLDLDLVEFSSGIPTHMKQRGHIGKWVLKKAMEPHLPREVIHRRKTGFGMPLRRWMRHELRDLVGDILSYDTVSHRGIFDPEQVQSLRSADEAGAIDASYVLFSLMVIELWCRTYLDGSAIPKSAPRAEPLTF